MKKTQLGSVFIVIILSVAVLVLYNDPDFRSNILTMAILAILLLMFYKLTIEVTDEVIKFSFGIGVIKGSYKLSEVKNCKSLKYTPLGWGIRYRPGVILYNVSGNKAIELEIKDKKRKVWIGTNSPDELVEYINSKRSEETSMPNP